MKKKKDACRRSRRLFIVRRLDSTMLSIIINNVGEMTRELEVLTVQEHGNHEVLSMVQQKL